MLKYLGVALLVFGLSACASRGSVEELNARIDRVDERSTSYDVEQDTRMDIMEIETDNSINRAFEQSMMK